MALSFKAAWDNGASRKGGLLKRKKERELPPSLLSLVERLVETAYP